MNRSLPTPWVPHRLASAVALALMATAGQAQETRLAPIYVDAHAEATPWNGTHQLDQAALRQLRASSSDTASLLRDAPGVTLNQAGGLSSLPSIRGLADDRLRVKVDGMDLIASCPNHMNPPLSYLDPSNLGSLKVFAGITPVSVGGDSIGGTIVAETPEPIFAEAGQGRLTQGEVGAFYRSNNQAVGANLTLIQATESVSLRYSGSWSRADNYRAADDFKTTLESGRPGHTLALDEVGSTAYETQNHTLDLALKSGVDLFELQLGYQDMPEQLYPNQRMDLLGNEQWRAAFAWTRAFGWGTLESRVYWESVDHRMDFGPDKRFWYGSLSGSGTPCAPIRFAGDPLGTCAAGMPMVSESDNLGVSVKAEVELSASELLRVGSEYQRYRLEDYWNASGGGMGPETFQNIHNGERDRVALFAEWEGQLNAQWLGLLGARYEQVDSDSAAVHGYRSSGMAPGNQIAEAAAFNAQDRQHADHNIDLTALARYRHSDQLDLELGLARKVRSPNLYERYTWSSWAMAATMNNFVGDGNGYVGNVDLDPEQAHTASVTLDWHAPDRRWSLSVTPFYTRVSDYIDALAVGAWTADRFNVLRYENVDARLYGVDLAFTRPLLENRWGQWTLQGVINYTDGENRDSGEGLYNIMPLHGRFSLTQQHGGWENRLEWVVVERKDQLSEVRNEVETAGYGLLNLQLSHQWQQWRVDLGVENLLDKDYDLPTGGAYTGQGMTMSINGIPWGVAVPGMGRSFYLGLNLSF